MGGGGIGVGRRPDHRELQLVQELPDVLACMVSGAVEEDDRVLSPIGPLLV